MTNTTDYTGPPPDDEHQLPTYEAAITRDPLPLVARYVRRQDVFAASLVSRRWRAALLPTLWEEPHRFWGLGRRSELCTCLPRSQCCHRYCYHYFCYCYCCCYCTISAIPQLVLRHCFCYYCNCYYCFYYCHDYSCFHYFYYYYCH